MKRGLITLLLGLLIAVSAFWGYRLFHGGGRQNLIQGRTPELAWLQEEFELSDREWKRVAELHEAYLPQCARMCEQIAKKNTELKSLLETADAVTPAIEAKMQEINELRSDCHANMLRHFFEVSRAMPPQQGRRYLQWVQARTILSDLGRMAEGQHSHE